MELGYFNKLETLDILRMCYFSISLPMVKIEKHQQEKADKSYLCSCVDSMFNNVKLTLSRIPIIFTVN